MYPATGRAFESLHCTVTTFSVRRRFTLFRVRSLLAVCGGGIDRGNALATEASVPFDRATNSIVRRLRARQNNRRGNFPTPCERGGAFAFPIGSKLVNPSLRRSLVPPVIAIHSVHGVGGHNRSRFVALLRDERVEIATNCLKRFSVLGGAPIGPAQWRLRIDVDLSMLVDD